MMLSNRHRRLARIMTGAVALGAAVYWLHPWPRTGADRIRHLISWPEECVKITTEAVAPRSLSPVGAWSAAQQRVQIQCEVAGPTVTYARFRSVRDRDLALKRHPPTGRYCVAGREVIINGLDSGFPDLCDRLSGSLVVRHRHARVQAPARGGQ